MRRSLGAVLGVWVNVARCDLRESTISARLKKIDMGAIAEFVRSNPAPFREVSIGYMKPRTSTGKWKLSRQTGEVLTLDHLPFRLAIVQELMYEQERLTPKFDVHDFAQDYARREIDPDDYTCEMIPLVQTWFRDLPIPDALAKHVEQFYFNGGNSIYSQLILHGAVKMISSRSHR